MHTADKMWTRFYNRAKEICSRLSFPGRKECLVIFYVKNGQLFNPGHLPVTNSRDLLTTAEEMTVGGNSGPGPCVVISSAKSPIISLTRPLIIAVSLVNGQELQIVPAYNRDYNRKCWVAVWGDTTADSGWLEITDRWQSAGDGTKLRQFASRRDALVNVTGSNAEVPISRDRLNIPWWAKLLPLWLTRY
jgi:hypothetical protein